MTHTALAVTDLPHYNFAIAGEYPAGAVPAQDGGQRERVRFSVLHLFRQCIRTGLSVAYSFWVLP